MKDVLATLDYDKNNKIFTLSEEEERSLYLQGDKKISGIFPYPETITLLFKSAVCYENGVVKTNLNILHKNINIKLDEKFDVQLSNFFNEEIKKNISTITALSENEQFKIIPVGIAILVDDQELEKRDWKFYTNDFLQESIISPEPFDIPGIPKTLIKDFLSYFFPNNKI